MNVFDEWLFDNQLNCQQLTINKRTMAVNPDIYFNGDDLDAILSCLDEDEGFRKQLAEPLNEVILWLFWVMYIYSVYIFSHVLAKIVQ